MTKLLATALLVMLTTARVSAEDVKRITVLYDAFGPSSSLVKDWGFATLVEYGGKRTLFDTGNDARIFEHNVRQLGVDLTRLDAVVISHRHGDHTSGLGYLLAVNPSVKIYAPQENAFFKSKPPVGFLEPEPGLPPELRYYGGRAPERWVSGTHERRFGGSPIFSTTRSRSRGLRRGIAQASSGSPCLSTDSESASTAQDLVA